MLYSLFFIVALICVYTARHYVFTLNRLFGFQRHPYIDIDVASWPRVTVFVAAHNEEKVIWNILAALMEVNYPKDKMLVVPINDRSTDRTAEIINLFSEENPGRIRPFHRAAGKAGKAAALKDAMESADTEVILIFDADYIPSSGLIKQLMRWAKGHNQALAAYSFRLLFGKHRATLRERIDGFLLLGVYGMALLMLIGWILALGLFYEGVAPLHGVIALLAITAYGAIGNFAAFFEIAAAARLDYTRQRIYLLPFLVLGFAVSIFSVSRACVSQMLAPITGAKFHWDKTQRFRTSR